MPRTELVRVYLPLSSSLLRRAREEGGFGPAPMRAHAVTPELEAELDGADQEECEYAALMAAAQESPTLLTLGDARRRVVAAVDVPAWEPRPEEGPEAASSAVSVPAVVPLRRLAAVLVGTDDVGPAPDGDQDGDQDGDEDDLRWYAAQELGVVVDMLADLAAGPRPGRGTIG